MRILYIFLLFSVGASALQHVLNDTYPIDPLFERVESTREEYSYAHCFSNSFQHDGWRSTSCILRNLCFNLTSREFVFYAKEKNHAPDPVSIGTFNYKWGKQYDNTVRFIPKIVLGPMPGSRFMAPAHEFWVPHLPFCPANIGHLIWDDYLTLYFFSWSAKPFFSPHENDLMLRPLWYNPPDDPPWATCDWIRLHEGPGHSLPAHYSDRCIKNNKRWLGMLIGNGHEALIETSKWSPSQSEVKDMVCFPSAGIGTTPYANQASGHHGWNPGDPGAPAFGRAPLMFEFTRHMMRKVGVFDVPKRSLKEIVVFFSSRSSDRLSIDFGQHVAATKKSLDKIQARVNQILGKQGDESLKIVVKHEVLFKMSAADQMRLTSTACVYITAAGGGAFTAQFLPRGASIILYQDSSGEHLHKGRVDWKVFNSATWIRSTFIDATEATKVEPLIAKISEEVLNCVSFMEALHI